MRLTQLFACTTLGMTIALTSCGLETSPAAAPAADRFGTADATSDPRGPGASGVGNQGANSPNGQVNNNQVNNNQGQINNTPGQNNNQGGVQGANLCQTLTPNAAMPPSYVSCASCHGVDGKQIALGVSTIADAGDFATALATLRAGVGSMPAIAAATMSDEDFAQVWVNSNDAVPTFNFPVGCIPTY